MNKNNHYHFVLVHGDCHGGWCWYKVATLLRSSGHKVTALDMAGCGMDQEQAPTTITDYNKPLMLFLEGLEEEERVVLVGQSRGGIDISIAMERYPRRIAASVFVAASMPGPNLDLPTICNKFDAQVISSMDNEYFYGKGRDKPPTSYIMGPDFLASKVYQLSPPEDLTLATMLLRPSPLYHDFNDPSPETALTEENYGSVPRVYIVSQQDNLMKEDMQRWLVDNNPPDEVRLIEGSDHMVMMSKPHELCLYLQQIGAKYCT